MIELNFIYETSLEIELSDKEKAMLELAFAKDLAETFTDPAKYEYNSAVRHLIQDGSTVNVESSAVNLKKRLIPQPNVVCVNVYSSEGHGTVWTISVWKLRKICQHYRVSDMEVMIDVLGFSEAWRSAWVAIYDGN